MTEARRQHGPQDARSAIALYAGVDLTLTARRSQEVFAEELGVLRKYRILERKYQSGVIDGMEFGAGIVTEFRAAGLTADNGRGIARRVPLRLGAERLLRSGVQVHLLSTGPSYFVHDLAARYGIPHERVVCSVYTFDERSGRLQNCRPAGADEKADHVSRTRARYVWTLGIGDDIKEDGPFLDQCHLGLLIQRGDFDVPKHMRQGVHASTTCAIRRLA